MNQRDPGFHGCRGLLLLAGIAALCGAGAARAVDISWDAPVGGVFSNAANWTGGDVPGVDNYAVFHQGGNFYTVTVDTSTTNTGLRIRNDAVKFDLDGQTYSLTSDAANNTAALVVGHSVGDIGAVEFSGGTLLSRGFRIGETATSTGSVVFTGSNTRWTNTNHAGDARQKTIVGVSGHGELRIEDGAQVHLEYVDGTSAAALQMGNASGSSANLVVTGSNTVLQTSSTNVFASLGVNAGSTIRVLVADGATWNADSSFYLNASRDAVMIVSNATVNTALNRLYFGQGNQAHATLLLRDGAQFTHTGTYPTLGINGATGVVDIAEGSTMTLIGSTVWLSYEFSDTAGPSKGVMTVRDGGTLVHTNGSAFQVGKFGRFGGGRGYLNVQTGGTAHISSRIEIGESGGRGWVTVDGTNATLYSYHSLTGVGYSSHTIFGDPEGTLGLSNDGRYIGAGTLRAYGNGWGTVQIDGGTIETGTLVLEVGSAFEVTLHTGGTNALITTGAAATITASVFNLSLAPGFSSSVDEVFNLIDVGTTLTGTFAGLGAGDKIPVGLYEFEINYDTDNGLVMLTTTAIPEPGALGLLALASSLLWLRRRHRRG